MGCEASLQGCCDEGQVARAPAGSSPIGHRRAVNTALRRLSRHPFRSLEERRVHPISFTAFYRKLFRSLTRTVASSCDGIAHLLWMSFRLPPGPNMQGLTYCSAASAMLSKIFSSAVAMAASNHHGSYQCLMGRTLRKDTTLAVIQQETTEIRLHHRTHVDPTPAIKEQQIPLAGHIFRTRRCGY